MLLKHSNVLLALFLAIVVSGCAGLSDYSLSVPSESDGNAAISKKGQLKLPEITLWIRPTNYALFNRGGAITPFPLPPFVPIPLDQEKLANPIYRSPYYAETDRINPPYFVVELALTPHQTNITFNPMEMFLRVDSGPEIQAAAYYAPSQVQKWAKTHVMKAVMSLCEEKLKEMVSTKQQIAVPLDNEMCFAVRFNVQPPALGSKFVLRIGGIRQKNNLVTIPVLNYVVETDRFIHN